MHASLLPILECPACRSARLLKLSVERRSGDDIEEGSLTCGDCAAAFPIRGGVPRFVDADAAYFRNFGFQWQRWKDIQIDSLAGHGLSERRFLADSQWSPEWLKGKLILDAGCGAGRFADVAAALGARVVACDISEAIDAARDVTRRHGENAACLQASIYALPFREGAFDAVYCMGVIQHTPDPEAAMRAMPRVLKPGGRLVYNFYEKGWRSRTQVLKHLLRAITPHLPIGWTLGLAKALVAVFFPMARILGGIPIVRQINHFLPICAVVDPALNGDQQRTWTLLDTFDWYGPRYEKRQDHRRVRALLADLRLASVDAAPGLAWARKPETEKAS